MLLVQVRRIHGKHADPQARSRLVEHIRRSGSVWSPFGIHQPPETGLPLGKPIGVGVDLEDERRACPDDAVDGDHHACEHTEAAAIRTTFSGVPRLAGGLLARLSGGSIRMLLRVAYWRLIP